MKKLLLNSVLLLLCTVNAFSQKATVTWGETFKLKKGSSDVSVIGTDNTGVYLQESHEVMRNYFSFTGNAYGTTSTLIKLDKNLTLQYKMSYDKPLKGKNFEQFFFLKNNLYIVASRYRKKVMTLYGAQVDLSSGALTGDWQEMTTWEKASKKDHINFNISCNADSSRLLVVSSISSITNSIYQIIPFDKNLSAAGKPLTISNEFDPKTFQLEDVLNISNGNTVVVGRVYEYEEGKKKKDKFLDFKNYNIRIYDLQAKLVKEINTDIEDKWLVSTKVVQEKDKDLILAAFYSDAKKGKTINGLLVQRINPITGAIITTSKKEINTSLISTIDSTNAADEDDADSKKSKQKDKEKEKLQDIQNAGDGFSKSMQFRNIYYMPDSGLVILAEEYSSYTYTSSYYVAGFNGSPGYWETRTYTVFQSGNLMMSKVDAAGNISWLDILPKFQQEEIGGASTSYGSGFSIGSSYFSGDFGPTYSGFGAIQTGNAINILFNDNPKNANVLQLGQKLKSAVNFRKSECFLVRLDAGTGKYRRVAMFANNEENPPVRPRYGSVVGSDMYMAGEKPKMIGKTHVAIVKISLID